MANVNSPFGLRPYGLAGGGVPRVNTFKQYTIAAALNATLSKNSPVILTGTGTNITASAGTSDTPIGVFNGCEYRDANTGRVIRAKNWVAQTVTKSGFPILAFVYDDPNMLYEVQGDNAAWVEADVGLNVDYVVGTAVNGVSGGYVTRTGINTTATLVCRIHEQSRRLTQTEWGAYARLVVTINANRHTSTTGA